MTKFECAASTAWDHVDINGYDDYIANCMSVGSEAIDLLREFYDNAQSVVVPSEWLVGRTQKLLEE